MNQEEILIIDVGNSYVKIGVYKLNNDQKILIELIKTKDVLNTNKIKMIFTNLKNNNIKHAIVGSVVLELKEFFNDLIEKNFKLKPYNINNKTKYSFSVSQKIRNEIGDDILALGQYCHTLNKNAIGFSFGTAISSVFIKENNLNGVFISSGLGFSLNHLIEKASMLKKVDLKKDSNLVYGTNTIEALEAGINIVRSGVVISAYNNIKKEHNINPICIISGGEAADIGETSFNYIINKEAILLGFKEIYLLNKNKE